MSRQFGRTSFVLGIVCACTVLLGTSTVARAQGFPYQLYQYSWFEVFNNSASASDVQDNWVANSFTVRSGATHITGLTLPIGAAFSGASISALIYTGNDVLDPTAGLSLVQETDFTMDIAQGSLVSLPLSSPLDLNPGDIMYAAVLLRGVPANVFPWYLDTAATGPLQTVALGRSFFDAGLTFGGPYNVNQGSANVTVLGGTHPILGGSIQDAGNLALWVNATPGQ